MKPRSRISNWLIQFAYEEESKAEYVYDGPETAPLLKGETKYYLKYHKLTMRKDLEGNPEQYKLLPDIKSMSLIPIERLIEIGTNNIEYGKLSGKYDLYTVEGERFINEVYNMLRSDVRRVVSVPMQWLVWIPSEKILTRLVFVRELGGEIIVRPFGSRGILLEVKEVKLDKANSWDTFAMKRACLTKNRLNDAWRALVVSEEMAAAVEGFEVERSEEVEKEEEAPEAVGEIE